MKHEESRNYRTLTKRDFMEKVRTGQLDLGKQLEVNPQHLGSYSEDVLCLSTSIKEDATKEVEVFNPRRNRTVIRKKTKVSPNTTTPNDVGSAVDSVKQLASEGKNGLIEQVDVKTAGVKAVETVTGVTEGQEMMIGAGKYIVAGVNLFIAGTTLMNTAIKAKHNKEERAQVEQQEKKLRKEEKRALEFRKKIHKRESNTRIRMGEEVFDMFNQAIGHHKMGNNRFY